MLLPSDASCFLVSAKEDRMQKLVESEMDRLLVPGPSSNISMWHVHSLLQQVSCNNNYAQDVTMTQLRIMSWANRQIYYLSRTHQLKLT